MRSNNAACYLQSPALVLSLLLSAFCMGCRNSGDAEIASLVSKIDEYPNPAHSDYTPAVYRLTEIGPRALPAVLPLLLSEDPDTREHGQRAAAGIMMYEYGFRFGVGWPNREANAAFERTWQQVGPLNEDDPLEVRQAAIKAWTEWARQRQRE